ncbi:hypothetical protein [Deinococcus sp. QL22]|uniref:hypothetical protein n=1 Tax=Deinococcus sp. QL22 TaxID=2939437 RepID=UPI0020172975|nr:hypothetical protein [Deinococcus sp. QL22]UQN08007.1 hypothetical protein M1R55_18105 [Deinococcus sp. QL22]
MRTFALVNLDREGGAVPENVQRWMQQPGVWLLGDLEGPFDVTLARDVAEAFASNVHEDWEDPTTCDFVV